ncbi:toll/interleukin-1 receptor domain-containing protein [Cryobacterium sp. 10S3]|uniref:toll/interleukin-1 receptor domain-containing protein n=1 Tax=Cryobacterium sp. 10S3 TaxID=3048582 RepID=UPI002AC94F1D|nr:toll/interleukin-1 receptor domain-containing protein [Cryobacterium sp. 10S3]MEB0285498.1 toll/interleukin-1 receptor domain-containing protein [Cryobacterium sp. 10S3]WPX15525.1 toll/interleukin-1 receptor domain-containing protein [Cryobacterium sp. 10S3]
MTATDFDAFWSYTHEDNDRSRNRVLKLAESLKDEFALSTGDELELFVDKDSLGWGDLWRERINGAIGDVPFFIPIVTPKFVRSEECRRELIEFSGLAKSRGLDKLLLPILYIDVPGLKSDSDDVVHALIARTQYVDWTKLRLLDPEDPRVLQAINDLALKIKELQNDVAESSLREETKTAEETEDDLRETIRAISERLERWMESVDFDKIAGAHWRAAVDERVARVNRLIQTRAPENAVFSTFVQLGKELLPIALNRLEKAKSYSRLTIELDPFVNTALRLVQMHREHSGLLNSLRDGVNEAYLNIEPPTGRSGFGFPSGVVDRNKHLTDADAALRAATTFVMEGNAIVLEWREKLMALDGPELVVLHRTY